MRKTLILYAGDFKTGTSTAQSILTNKSASLKNYGLLYPSSGRNGLNSHRLLMEDLKKLNNHDDSSLPHWIQLNKEVEKTNCDTVLVAQEAFQNFINPNTWEFVTSIFPDIDMKLLYYVRPHGDVFLSRFIQRLKFGKTSGSFDDFFKRSLSQRLFHYEDKYLQWSSIFGEENVCFRLYDRKELFNNDIYADVIDAISRISPSAISKQEIIEPSDQLSDRNISPNAFTLTLMQIYRNAVKNHRSPRILLKRKVATNLSEPVYNALSKLNDLSDDKLKIPESLHEIFFETYLEDAKFLDNIVFKGNYFVKALKNLDVTDDEDQLNPQKRFNSSHLQIIEQTFEALIPIILQHEGQ